MKDAIKKVAVMAVVSLGLTQLSRAEYSPGYVWDFEEQFSTETTQVQDSEGNVAWEYRAGAWNQLPSQAGFYPYFASWQNPPVWEGNTVARSGLGDGYICACQPGVGDQFPFLVWRSNINGKVDVNLSISNATANYQATIFKNDDELDYQGGILEDYNFSNTLDVAIGDMVTLKFGSWGTYPEANVSFSVTMPAMTQILGDANGDGMVDVGDLGILAGNYGIVGGATWAMGDFNNDGNVDVGDLGILAGNYGSGAAASASVPEPVSLSLMGLGTVALLRRKRS